MLIILLSYFGGVLTIFSPCVLPVLPFIFSKSDQPFRKSGLPILIGMSLTFALVATVSAAGGSWIGRANELGRSAALLIFFLLGVTLVFPQVAERIAAPFTKLGALIQRRADSRGGWAGSLLVGISVGFLWAPCTGPILGLVLAGASLEKSYASTFGLMLAFACGAASSLAVAIFASSRFIGKLKRGLGAEVWIKQSLGIVVLITVSLIALGLDTRILARFSYINTGSIEQKWVDAFTGKKAAPTVTDLSALTDEGSASDFRGAIEWINSPPLNLEELKGKVVLVDFWTYSCINCLRTLPYIKDWYSRYKDKGLVVIGVHSPEFAFEKEPNNVKAAVKDLGITYPVAVDSDLAIWSDYRNQYWPAHYFLDIHGQIRHHHFGEGNYAESEKIIQTLLAERNPSQALTLGSSAMVNPPGVESPPSQVKDRSPETYLGFDRQERNANQPELVLDQVRTYVEPKSLELNQWALAGQWKVTDQNANLVNGKGAIIFRFRGRDLHLVIGLKQNSKANPKQFRVTLDGNPPNLNHGVDTDASGEGYVKEHRLYQLIRQTPRQTGESEDHVFRIEFQEPGVEVYAITFG